MTQRSLRLLGIPLTHSSTHSLTHSFPSHSLTLTFHPITPPSIHILSLPPFMSPSFPSLPLCLSPSLLPFIYAVPSTPSLSLPFLHSISSPPFPSLFFLHSLSFTPPVCLLLTLPYPLFFHFTAFPFSLFRVFFLYPLLHPIHVFSFFPVFRFSLSSPCLSLSFIHFLPFLFP